MIPIQVRILQGTSTGRTRTFDEPKLAFGRSGDNHIVVDVPEASRYHGALVFQDDHWTIINNSPNGTSVNGRKPGKKPIVLKSGDVIGVGKFSLFEVGIGPAAPGEPAAAPPDAQAPAQIDEQTDTQAGARRNKLWIGIGVYLVLTLIGFVVLTQVVGDAPEGDRKAAKPLTPDQIAEEIRTPIQVNGPNERLAGDALAKAQEFYQQAQVNPSARYKAYRAFKQADAYSRGALFNNPDDPTAGINRREYKKCEQELIDSVVKKYFMAYNRLKGSQWADAERDFRDVQRMYPDTTSIIFRNASKQIQVAQANNRDRRR
jgi:hypothetical protein